MNSYRIIGIMSGTSMDGVDIADVSFYKGPDETWSHVVHHTQTIPYPKVLEDQLRTSVSMTSQALVLLDKQLGHYFGSIINEFIEVHQLEKSKIDAIASHGHTIFHQPENGFTLQIGCGTSIAVETGISVINDFRTKDVLAGGQGAPLVPIGDKLLYSKLADSFLNLGGFSNVCILSNPIVAFDIAPCNLPLNELMLEHYGKSYDQNGDIARSGKIIPAMADALNSLAYYQLAPPKSLGTEWMMAEFAPIIAKFKSENPANLLRTITDHVATQIANTLNLQCAKKVLITGGGAKNNYLVECINARFNGEVILPELALIDFKEAIIFGLLGALYLDGQTNTLSEVTGAKYPVRAGVFHSV